ncbi:MAG: hypothetical protein ACXAB7_19460 [Candidatus Kariarchaeaceae archaeon]|jgi:hypothetical protein
MTEFKIYNCLRSGAISEVRNVKSTYIHSRTLLIQDPYNRKIWLLHGLEVDSEIKRLSSFSADELVNKLGYSLEVVSGLDFDDKTMYFLDIETNKKDTRPALKTKPGPTTTTKKMAKPDKSVSVTKETSKKTVDDLLKSIPTQRKTKHETPQIKETARIDSKVEELRQTIPAPSKKTLPVNDIREEPLLKAEMTKVGPVIEEFQISYYEKSGGSNYILVEELDRAIENSDDFDIIINHVSLINELVKSGAGKEEASNKLHNSVDHLIDKFFK